MQPDPGFRHRLIAEVLAQFDPEFLNRAGIGFGGGTRIALELDEYRESIDIDLFCPSTASYQAVRETVGEHSLGALLRSPLTFAREIRTTRDKVVTAIAHKAPNLKPFRRDVMLTDPEYRANSRTRRFRSPPYA